ncbi:XdhC family protein [Heyndrickxia coagulans]|uniref:XdhC family protein n=1 Tax=Heyndrickxia coagulans TaxID=1398 RepID=UPI000E4E2934|nr:XdhC family protein [Heyndrickxia coagulans]RGR84994.1 XdhC family protein [Heyndrickxia coagulans]RGR98212.1 XdhC family protein [Heyndrickxia coagulans]
MEDMYSILEEISPDSSGSVLATVIRVEGSAYKKTGASMLIKPDGTWTGLLSAGCLEEDLAARIQAGLGRKPETVVYDMRSDDDLAWGTGSGCNGAIHIYIEPVDAGYAAHLLEFKQLLKNGTAVTGIKFLASGTYLFITEDGKQFGSFQGELDEDVVRCIRMKKGTFIFPAQQEEVYIRHYRPKPRFILFGAGKDAMPLCALAAKAGFSVIVSDWRPGLCNRNHFPDADEIAAGFPAEVFTAGRITIHRDDYVMIMTHNFSRDQEILAYVLQKNPHYLGVLGSAKRTKRLLGTEKLPPGVRSPAGLSISAEGPEEIAISIVAECIQLKNGRVGEGVLI